MRIVFFGTPELARDILIEVDRCHEIAAVVCREDANKGRGKKLKACEVKEYALKNGYKILQPKRLNDEFFAELKEIDFDAAVVAAYGKIIPEHILNLPKYGFINVHASLLPRWRGAAPIERAIIAGDENSGVSIMKMEAGLDTGPVYLDKKIPLEKTEDGSSLRKKIVKVGSELLLETLDLILKDEIQPVTQAESGVSYAHKIRKDEGVIDFNSELKTIDCMIRGLYPYPSAKITYKGELWKIYRAEKVEYAEFEKAKGVTLGRERRFGEIVALGDAVYIYANGGILKINELQRTGGKVLNVKDFLNGTKPELGYVFGADIEKE